MKIVFVIATLSTGGAQMMLVRLLERLQPRFIPHVISLSTLGSIGPAIQALGVSLETLGMRPGVPSPSAFIRLVRRIKALAPDVVHTWMYHADLAGGVAARLAGVGSIVWSIRHANLDADKNKYSTLAVVQACALLSAWVPTIILSNSDQARRVHIARGYEERKMRVIPNGFDLGPFRPDPAARTSVRRELDIPEGALIVGLVGRFHPQKNIEGFFDAARRLHSHLPDVYFVLAGERLEMSNPSIASAVQHAGVGSVTRLLGIRTDVPRLMAAMDVLASSSSGEAFPNAVGEAMACAIPCVVTDVGDSAYVVGKTGRVVKPSDMEGLASAIEEILGLTADERAALCARSRDRIAENFEIGKIVNRYEALYEELM